MNKEIKSDDNKIVHYYATQYRIREIKNNVGVSIYVPEYNRLEGTLQLNLENWISMNKEDEFITSYQEALDKINKFDEFQIVSETIHNIVLE